MSSEDALWQAEAVALHAGPVFLNHGLAVGLRVGSVGEEHAFVTGGFLVFANAAWLSQLVNKWAGNVGRRRQHTLTLAAASP